jgi:Ser-tRNA(Ala) deacylase AlaX
METNLAYFKDTLLLSHNSKVLEVKESEVKDCKNSIILDSTIFHPQGGGQPADQGRIFNKNFSFQVLHVTKQDSIVLHHGNFISGETANPNDQVSMEVNRDRRFLNARLHTAGHLLEQPLFAMGYKSTGGKGYHFPDGPYVDLQLDPPIPNCTDLKELANQISDSVNSLIQKDLKYTPKLLKYDQLPEYTKRFVKPCCSEDVRIMELEGFETQALPCGGTHVPNLRLIGGINIKKCSLKNGFLRISYTLLEN